MVVGQLAVSVDRAQALESEYPEIRSFCVISCVVFSTVISSAKIRMEWTLNVHVSCKIPVGDLSCGHSCHHVYDGVDKLPLLLW